MFIVSYETPDRVRRHELLDSLKEFQDFLKKNQNFMLLESWHLMCNFGCEDVTQEVFDSIYAAKLNVETTVENTHFEEYSGSKMKFTVISAMSFT